MDIGRATADAFGRTRYLLFERASWGRWGAFVLLHLLSGGGVGAHFNVGVPLPEGSGGDRRSALSVLGAAGMGALPAGAAIAIGAVVIAVLAVGLFFAWLGGIAWVVMVESLHRDRHAVVEPFGRHARAGTGVFLFNLALGLGALAVLALVVGLPAWGLYAAGWFTEERLLPTLLALCLLGLAAALVVVAAALVKLLNNELAVPLMYRLGVGEREAWRRLWGLLRERPGPWLLYLVMRTVYWMAGAFALALAGLLFLVVFGLLVLFLVGLPTAVLAFAFPESAAVIGIAGLVSGVLLLLVLYIPTAVALGTPLTVFLRCFSLYALQQLGTEELRLLPPGGRPETASAVAGS